MTKRKKISQREAQRNRKELRLLRERIENWRRGSFAWTEKIAAFDCDDYSAGKLAVGAMFGRFLVATIDGREVKFFSVKAAE